MQNGNDPKKICGLGDAPDIKPNTESPNITGALEEVASARRAALRTLQHSSIVHLADVEIEEFRVTASTQGRKSWHICSKVLADDIQNEIVFRLQAAPRVEHIFWTQQAEISGLDTTTFLASIAKLESIHDLFTQYLPGIDIISLNKCSPQNAACLGASNRVFTFKSDMPTEQDNEFQRGIDPVGLLAHQETTNCLVAYSQSYWRALQTTRNKIWRIDHQFGHPFNSGSEHGLAYQATASTGATERNLAKSSFPDAKLNPDNIVRYFKKGESSTKYEDFIPGEFKVGDIVEAQVCFVALASKNGGAKITTRLQAVTLLDNQYSKLDLSLGQ
ncbi:hypothetical protein B0H12DRAFT_1305428 [Mycena haematopus]|nr:hypothetical protein B0H12DRAFT_1305428 [Mycena haematopus]